MLKLSDGFTNLLPGIGVLLGMGLSFVGIAAIIGGVVLLNASGQKAHV